MDINEFRKKYFVDDGKIVSKKKNKYPKFKQRVAIALSVCGLSKKKTSKN